MLKSVDEIGLQMLCVSEEGCVCFAFELLQSVMNLVILYICLYEFKSV